MKTGSIISGTHRTQDLIPAFISVLREVDEAAYAQLLVNGGVPAHADEDDDADWWHSEQASFLLEDLFDTLDENAPEGHYFGAHPGDGADFGFWENEE